MKYFPDNPWVIAEDEFKQEWLGKTEAVFSLGNGYMGIRSANEESYIGETRDTFVAGTFNKFDANEVTELPNVPDMIGMEFIVNGVRLDLTQGIVKKYQKSLNLKTGELQRTFLWETGNLRLAFQFARFVSLQDKHLFGQKVTIKNLSEKKISLEIVSGINGQLTNSGSQHFTEGDKALAEGQFIQMMPFTSQSKIFFVLSTVHNFQLDGKNIYENIAKRIEMGRRKIYNRYWVDIESQNELVVEKISTIHTSIDKEKTGQTLEQVKQYALEHLKTAKQAGFDQLLESSAVAWEKIVWSKYPIIIDSSNPNDQLAIHFAKYHLHVMVPSHDERMNIGAKGFSGEGYKGHTFWDSEIFMLPYFIFTHPEIAKSLVTYRYLGLEGAHKKALQNGFEGAQFPWEAAWPDDGETTPIWGAADIITGKPTKIWSGFIEQHITSDVTFGVKQYADVTNDLQFLQEKGYEIIFDTAKFWNSRFEWQESRQRFEILNVVGPDEYTEHADNNAFTNYGAHWNVRLAMRLYKKLEEEQPGIFNRLDEKLQLKRAYQQWEERIDKLYLPQPNEDKVIPQDDAFLSKKIIDLDKYKAADQVGTLFYDYNLDQVNNMQIAKQADVLLLLFLFEDLFEKEEKLINWNYYEPKTMHDSSLSLSTHAILAADLGKLEESYRLFQRAIRIDMGENMLSSNEGIHGASLGGIWQSVVFGYGGVRSLDGHLRIEPHLPREWNQLTFGFEWHRQPLQVVVTKETFTVKNQGEEAIDFISFDNHYQLKATEVLSINLK